MANDEHGFLPGLPEHVRSELKAEQAAAAEREAEAAEEYVRYEATFRIERPLDKEEDDAESLYYTHIEQRLERIEVDVDCNERNRQTIGRGTAYLMRVEAVEVDWKPAQFYDAISQEAIDAFLAVLDPRTADYLPQVLDLLDDPPWSTNLLYCHGFELLPAYRGRGMGLKAIRCLLDTFRDQYGVAVIQAYPIHDPENPHAVYCNRPWYRAMRYDSFTARHAAAAAKIARHWQQLGFKPLPNSNWHIWDGYPTEATSE